MYLPFAPVHNQSKKNFSPDLDLVHYFGLILGPVWFDQRNVTG